MRLQRHLNEAVKPSFQEVITVLWDNSKPFLKDMEKENMFKGKQYMFSGRDSTQYYMINTIRKDRTPLDMEIKVHNALDKLIQKKFGFKGRSNVVFTTGNWSFASGYGRTFMIFPIGKYKFLYHPVYMDLVLSLDGPGVSFGQYIHKWVLDNRYDELYDFVKKDTNMNYPKWTEEMVRYFVKLELNSLLYGEKWIIKMLMKNSIKRKISKYAFPEWVQDKLKPLVSEFKSKGLKKAVESGNEIMLHGDKYVAIYDGYMKLISDWFTSEGVETKPTTENIQAWMKKLGYKDTFKGYNLLKDTPKDDTRIGL